MRLRAFLVALGLVLGGVVGIAQPAQAATGNILPPFDLGTTWNICQGYNNPGVTHTGTSSYGLDLTGAGCDNSASGRTVRAPMAGTVYYYQASYGNLCVNVAGGRSYTLTHINGSVTSGSVSAGQSVGTVAAPGTRGNNGVAHIHFQMWSTSNCYSSSGIPFDTSHGTRICGAPDLTASGPNGGNGTWSGTSFTGQDCSTPVVDGDGDGVPNGSDACPTEFGPAALNGCPDTDFDGVANASDKCPKFYGTAKNRGCRLDSHTVSGNFVGNDGVDDTITFYDYTSNNLGAFVSQGGANGLGQPQPLWTTGTGQWNWGASVFYAGNFAGNSYTDVIGLYDYGNGRLGAFLFEGNGTGVGQAQHLWTTGYDTWALGHARYVVGNFAGNDGHDDIVAFYGYTGNETRAFTLAGNGSGVGQPDEQWTTGPEQWNARNAEYVTGNFAGNDNYTDVIAFYQYEGNDMGVFLFEGSSGDLGQAQHLWNSGWDTWNIRHAQFFAGDFAGGDSDTDIVALYNLGNENMGSYIMEGNGDGVDEVTPTWTTGAGTWNLTNTKAVAGKFSGSGTSLFGWYNYGSTTGGALFGTASPSAGVLQPQIKWSTSPGAWGWVSM